MKPRRGSGSGEHETVFKPSASAWSGVRAQSPLTLSLVRATFAKEWASPPYVWMLGKVKEPLRSPVMILTSRSVRLRLRQQSHGRRLSMLVANVI